MDTVKKFRRRRELRLLHRGIRLDEWKESDHPRDENGRFSNGSGGGAFSADAYSKERKSAAKRYKADDVVSKEFEKNHFKNDLNSAERSAVESYTGDHYREINGGLRNESSINLRLSRDIDNLTAVIDRNELGEDTYFKRRLNGLTAFNLSDMEREFEQKCMWTQLTQKDVDEISKKLVGSVFTDDGFMSSDTAADSARASYSEYVNMNIYAPKGTKAMFVAPISEVPLERETIIQRGTSYMITGVRANEDRGAWARGNGYNGIIIDVEIVDQSPKEPTEGANGSSVYNKKKKK